LPPNAIWQTEDANFREFFAQNYRIIYVGGTKSKKWEGMKMRAHNKAQIKSMYSDAIIVRTRDAK